MVPGQEPPETAGAGEDCDCAGAGACVGCWSPSPALEAEPDELAADPDDRAGAVVPLVEEVV